MLTMADKGWRVEGEGLDLPFLADIICEQPIINDVINNLYYMFFFLLLYSDVFIMS